MTNPTPAQIESFLSKLTSEEDRNIFLTMQALLVSAQTQTILYHSALKKTGNLAGSIGVNIDDATKKLNKLSKEGNSEVSASLDSVRVAYENASGGIEAGMASAKNFLEVYKQKSDGSANPGSLFKEVASGLLSVVFPGASNLFNMLGKRT